jgi:hypothetical protein
MSEKLFRAKWRFKSYCAPALDETVVGVHDDDVVAARVDAEAGDGGGRVVREPARHPLARQVDGDERVVVVGHDRERAAGVHL